MTISTPELGRNSVVLKWQFFCGGFTNEFSVAVFGDAKKFDFTRGVADVESKV